MGFSLEVGGAAAALTNGAAALQQQSELLLQANKIANENAESKAAE